MCNKSQYRVFCFTTYCAVSVCFNYITTHFESTEDNRVAKAWHCRQQRTKKEKKEDDVGRKVRNGTVKVKRK
jgi:hypothetical protein